MSSKSSIKFISVSLGLLLLTGASGFVWGHASAQATGSFNPNAVVAKVGNETITQADLYATLAPQYGKAASDSMVVSTLLGLEAKAHGITISNAQVQNELNQVELGYGGQAAMLSALAQQGKTLAGLKANIITYLDMEQLLAPTIHPTPAQIKAYFLQHEATYNTPMEVQASNILVKSLATAQMLEAKLHLGLSFASLAKQYSLDRVSGASGGNLGFFSRTNMIPAFADAAFALKVGQISAPVQTQYGYNIIKVTAIQPAHQAQLKDVQAQVVTALKNQDIQALYPSWLAQQEKAYHVVDTLDPNIISESANSGSNSSSSTSTSTGQ